MEIFFLSRLKSCASLFRRDNSHRRWRRYYPPRISFDLNHRRWKYILYHRRCTHESMHPVPPRNCWSSVTLSSMTDWRRVGRGVAASTRWKQNTPTPCFSNDLGIVCPLLDASEREKTARLFRGKSRNFRSRREWAEPNIWHAPRSKLIALHVSLLPSSTTWRVRHVTSAHMLFAMESFSCFSLSIWDSIFSKIIVRRSIAFVSIIVVLRQEEQNIV